jgi:ADP-ribose pyrophosphatase YjhB (NUDIX family)
VLLGKRGGSPGKGTWSLPSGYVDYEEDFLTAGIRETKEETGLDVEVCSIINVVSSFVSPRFHFLGLYLVAQVLGGELVAGDDLEAVEWYPVEGPLPEMGFQEDVDIIEMCARGFAGLPVDPEYAAAASKP